MCQPASVPPEEDELRGLCSAANLTASAQDATRLARLRYNGGLTGYLEVLTNDSNYYTAQLNLAVAQENEALSIVQRYSKLGGDWQ